MMNLDDGPRGVDMMDNLPASWMSAPDADSGRRNLWNVGLQERHARYKISSNRPLLQ